ncbi:MAG: hypothetical protein ACRCWJ_15125 [Casimicrobium sp.]
MSPTIEIRPARFTDVGPIATTLRDIDARELALTGMSAKQALRHGITHGDAWTILLDGQRVMMFGTVDLSVVEGRARVWAVATAAAETRWRALVPVGDYVLSKMRERYMALENHVHADNAKAIRWLRWSGFSVGEPEDIGGQMLRKLSLCADQPPLS